MAQQQNISPACDVQTGLLNVNPEYSED